MLKGFKRNGFAEIRQGPLIKLVVCLFTLWIACEAAAQSTLPPQVQADLLKQQIVDALKQEDLKAALAAFDKYHALKVKMPPPLLFLEAKAASAAGDPLRAFKSLEAFLKATPQEGKQYSEALTLYPQYETAAGPALEKAKAEAQARAKAAAEAEARAAAEARAKAEAEAQARAEAERAACASNPACNFEDRGSGVLKQVSTGVEWTQSDNGSDINWEGANSWCSNKGDGWRLPTVEELLSLYDKSGAVKTPCGEFTCEVSPLFRLSSEWFWSGEREGSSEAWFVNLFNGVRHSSDVSYTYYKRALCARRS